MNKIDLSKGSSDLGDIVRQLEEHSSHHWNHVRIDENRGHAECGTCGLKVFYDPSNFSSAAFYNKWITCGAGFTPPTCEDYQSKEEKSEEDGGWVLKEDWEFLIRHA